MSLYKIPLAKTPNQSLNVTLNGQVISITLNTRLNNELYISVTADDVSVVNNRICRNGERLVNADYRAINGELLFIDVLGSSDPTWDKLNERFFLVWIDDEF